MCNFDQSDLCVDDIMLLDTVASVFVWVGPQANAIERTEVRLGAHLAGPCRAEGKGRGRRGGGGMGERGGEGREGRRNRGNGV